MSDSRSPDPAPDPNPTPRPAMDLDARLEQEIEAALGDASVEDLLEPEPTPRSGGRDVRTGRVVAVHGDDVLVEFGPRTQGVCKLAQFDEPPAVGADMEFEVDRLDEREGLLILTRRGAARKADWESLETGQVVEGRAVGVVKGGLEVMIANHKAFLPASHVDLHFVKDISILLNEKITCEVIRLDKRRGRIVVSRRNVIEAERAQRREELMGDLQVGRKVVAVITTIQPYGAFADIGGMDGLIHISDLSHRRVNHPSEVVKEGDQVEVQILKIDRGQEPPRIGLGLKQCQADPFESRAAELSEGEPVTGKVTRITEFGAFVELSPGVEGLIHISQLAHERVHKVSHVVKEGEVVTVRVLSIDPASRRIALSLKALKDAPGGDAEGDLRREDPHLRKLKAQLSSRFGDNLKGGLG